MEAVRVVMSAMWMQDSGSLSSGNSKLLMFFVGMVAAALSAQAIALIVMAVGAAKARKRGLEIAEEVRAKIMPMIESTHGMVHDLRPKMKVITDNLMETSHIVRSKAQEFDVTAGDVNSRTRAQVARVDGMVTSVLNTTSEITDSLQRAVKVPVREFNGLVKGLKAGIDVLVGRSKGRSSTEGVRNRDTEW
jgi:methyl-accepting chemotaxis protein